MFGVVAAMAAVQGESQFLNGGDDHLVGVVLGEQSANEGTGVGVGLHAAFLKLVEFFTGLAIQVLAVHDEEALVNVRVVLQQGGRLEGGQGLAAARGVPDITIAAMLVDAVHDGLDGIDLVGPHHQELLFAGDQDHVAADHLPQGAFGEEGIGEFVQVVDLAVVLAGEPVHRQKTLIGMEGEMTTVVVGEVASFAAVADDEELQKTEQGLGVAVAGVVLVLDDLLDGAARADVQGLQLDLDDRHAIEQEDHVITVVAVFGVDPKLVNHLEGVLAPVLDVDQGVVERCPIIALEAVAFPEHPGSGIHVRGHDGVQQAMELRIRQMNLVQRLKVPPKIVLHGGAVADVGAVGILEVLELPDQGLFDEL